MHRAAWHVKAGRVFVQKLAPKGITVGKHPA